MSQRKYDRTRGQHWNSECERAVSIALTHALTIAITTVLLSGLLVASGPFLESQEQRVADDQLDEIVNHAASQVAALDSHAEGNGDVEMSVTLNYPRTVVDQYSYTVELEEDGGDAVVTVRTAGLDRESSITLETEAGIEPSQTDGSVVELSLCQDENEITLSGCDT